MILILITVASCALNFALDTTWQLSQIIELGDKRSARVSVATAFRDHSNEDYEIKRIEVLSSLTDQFVRTLR